MGKVNEMICSQCKKEFQWGGVKWVTPKKKDGERESHNFCSDDCIDKFKESNFEKQYMMQGPVPYFLTWKDFKKEKVNE
jgi:hypothetical protein